MPRQRYRRGDISMDVRRAFTSETGETNADRIEHLVALARDDRVRNHHMTDEEARRALQGDAVGPDEDHARSLLQTMLVIYSILRRLELDF